MGPTGADPVPLSMSTTVTHADGVIDGEMDSEVVLMSVANGEYYALDPVASRLWKLVATPQRVGDLCRTLHGQYEAPLDVITADVLGFVGDLTQRGLLRIDG